MTWADFYLLCFAVGFVFSLVGFLLGGLNWHLPFHVHVDGSHVHAVTHVPASPAGSAAHGTGTSAHGSGASHGGEISPLNPVTLAAFLAWFGGTGYLLTRYSRVWSVMGLGLASVSGLVGAGAVFLFLTRILSAQDEALESEDFGMVGVLGRVSLPIREGGTGEIIYSQAGTRRTCGARAEDEMAIAKGTEVVVTRYEKGLAYVKLWSELSGEGTDSVPNELDLRK